MHRGAAVFVRVTSEQVETWTLARTEAGGPARMSVDYAWGCLTDESFVQDHDEWLQTPASETAPYEQDRPYLDLDDGRVLLFDCGGGGGGDGVYDIWHGTDRSGNVACLLVDLELVSTE